MLQRPEKRRWNGNFALGVLRCFLNHLLWSLITISLIIFILQTPVIRPKPSSKRAYISPPDFNARNSKLMGTISTAFGGAKSLEFNTFKGLSNQFRSGKINAINYLEECSNLLDSTKKFDDFMPEMIALLPNISKQTVSWMFKCQYYWCIRKKG